MYSMRLHQVGTQLAPASVKAAFGRNLAHYIAHVGLYAGNNNFVSRKPGSFCMADGVSPQEADIVQPPHWELESFRRTPPSIPQCRYAETRENECWKSACYRRSGSLGMRRSGFSRSAMSWCSTVVYRRSGISHGSSIWCSTRQLLQSRIGAHL
jgi:hypothetical protein